MELSAFAVTNALGGVLISWRTESEIHNVGFNPYRSETKGGDDHKIAFIDGAGSTPVARDYQFVDRKVQSGQTYYYYLEDVDAQGIANRLPEIEFEKPRRWKSRVITVLGQPPSLSNRPLPRKFRLRQNYPNPFNPETWPYSTSVKIAFFFYDSLLACPILTLG